MDDIFSQLLPSLGPWGAVTFLGWWVINTQQKALAAKDARIEKLTDQLTSLGSSTAQVLAELRAAIKG